MTVTGEIERLIAALGSSEKDQAALDAMVLAGLPTKSQEFRDGGVTTTYLISEEGGTDFLFEDGALDSVLVRMQPEPPYAIYPRPDALIAGLSAGVDRASVRQLMGDDPEWSGPNADRWNVGDASVHFEFDDDALSLITIMRAAPGA